jgi:DNA-binding HxlR family transcriptional regulator
MKEYGQFCPIAKAAEIFCERWTALVIRNLGAGAERFNDIHRGVPHMSATLLARRLRRLGRRSCRAQTKPDGKKLDISPDECRC